LTAAPAESVRKDEPEDLFAWARAAADDVETSEVVEA